MSIGALSLTTEIRPNVQYVTKMGLIHQDDPKRRICKYFVNLGCVQIFWEPHKFGRLTNWGIPYTKIDIQTKYFDRFELLRDYLFDLFPKNISIDLNEFNIPRIEIHSDIEILPLDVVLARLWVMGFRRESVSFYKGNTIYIGSNPKIRIFDKTKQILGNVAKGKPLSKGEKAILKEKSRITRFSIEIRNFGKTLLDIANDPNQLVSHFDRFKFYNFEDEGIIPKLGGLQILMSKIRREHRKSFERFKDKDLERLLKQNFLSSIRSFFKEEAKKKEPDNWVNELEKQVNQFINSMKEI